MKQILLTILGIVSAVFIAYPPIPVIKVFAAVIVGLFVAAGAWRFFAPTILILSGSNTPSRCMAYSTVLKVLTHGAAEAVYVYMERWIHRTDTPRMTFLRKLKLAQ